MKRKWQGMNWIRQSKRLAIYLRDGLACAWCGVTVEDGAQLTLDHLKPHSKGGSNVHPNLATACKRCNDSRGARSVAKFSVVVAAYLNHGVKPEAIRAAIYKRSAKSLKPFIREARKLIAKRGSVFAVLNQKGTK